MTLVPVLAFSGQWFHFHKAGGLCILAHQKKFVVALPGHGSPLFGELVSVTHNILLELS
jgi:hypothetical protein